MKVVIGGSLGSVDLAIRRYVDLYGRSHVEKLPAMESRVLDELKEYNQKLESIKLENRKLYISSLKSDNHKQETGGIDEIDSNQKQETTKTEEIDSDQKIETNKTERRKSIVERMKEGEDDPNDFWYNPTHEDLSLKPQDVKIMEGMLAFRDRLAKLSDSIPLDFSDMVCIGNEKPDGGKSDTEEAEGEVARDVDDEEEKEGNSPNWGDNDDESGENESDDESDFDDGWEESDSESSEESEESWESDEKESEENDVEDEDDSDTWGSSEDDSEDDMNDGWGFDDSDDSDSTDENTEKEESEESGSYDWNDMGSWDSKDSDDEDKGGETKGNEEGEEYEGTNETTEDDNFTEVDTYEDDQGNWDLDGWSDDSEDDDTGVQVEKSEDDVKKDLKKVFGISLKTDKKGEDEPRSEDVGGEKGIRREGIAEEKEARREDIKEEKEVEPRRKGIKEEKVANSRRRDIGDVDDDFWNDEGSEKEVQKQEVVVKKKEAPVSYDTSSLRGFVKSHKGCKCTIEEALQYFKKADIEKDLRMGRVFKGKKSLFI